MGEPGEDPEVGGINRGAVSRLLGVTGEMGDLDRNRCRCGVECSCGVECRCFSASTASSSSSCRRPLATAPESAIMSRWAAPPLFVLAAEAGCNGKGAKTRVGVKEEETLSGVIAGMSLVSRRKVVIVVGVNLPTSNAGID